MSAKTIKCLRCGKTFTTKISWTKYCSATCRNLDWVDSHPRTRIGALQNADPCFYCGVIADTVDHIPPLSIRDRLVELKIEHRFPFKEVRACKECNSLLGARAPFTIRERKKYIKMILFKRYRRYLNIPSWSDSELSRLEPTLKNYVIHGLLVKELIIERLRY